MTRRLLILTSVLTVFGAACTNLPKAQVNLGTGQRFVPTIADAIDNVGLGNSVAVDAHGDPFISYFGFKGQTPPGGIPIPRPIGSPNVPGFFVTTEKDGLWTRGAAAMVGTGPAGLTIPFGPAQVKTADAITPTNTNGSDLVLDPSGGLHVVWTDGEGVWAFRDQLGFRSLFHRVEAGRTFVASEAKQVAAGARIAREPDTDVLEAIFVKNR